MNGRCAMAGRPCPNDPLCIVRISGVGDRALCRSCIAVLERLGMSFRRLDDTAPPPEWRRRLPAVDMTGALR